MLTILYLMGIGLALPWRWAASRRSPRYLLAAAGLTVLLLYPVYHERATYLAQNTRWMVASRSAYAAEEKDVNALVAWLRHQGCARPGPVAGVSPRGQNTCPFT
jgi:glucose dehydrogenase